MVILVIYWYVYPFCTIFPLKFNYNVVIRQICFGNFENLLICISIHSVSFCNVNSTIIVMGVCAVIRMTCFHFITTEQKCNVNQYHFLFGMTMGKKVCVIICGNHYKHTAVKFIKISKYRLFIVFPVTDYMYWVHMCL